MKQLNIRTGFENLSPGHYAVKLAHQQTRSMSHSDVEEHICKNSKLLQYRDYVQAVWTLYKEYEQMT